jgi:hypothetical protein
MTGFFLEKIGCLGPIERKKSKRSVRVGQRGDSMVKRYGWEAARDFSRS